MKTFKNLIYRTILTLIISWLCYDTYAQHIISYSFEETGFPVANKKEITQVLHDNNEPEVVSIASEMFVQDVRKITDKQPEIINNIDDAGNVILIVGTMGYSDLIDQLVEQQIINPDLTGQWEAYQYFHIKNPFPNIKEALVIAGSDRRGTAYGLMDLSRSIGVSPWTWWADVIPEKHDEIYIQADNSQVNSPSVKYRGMFLNDEDWGLQPWAAKTYEPETGDIGPKTYAKIFELMLRLKANLIWPAMHNTTKAFYHYPDNPKVANDYAIVVGSSHAEPMLRNNVDEWDKSQYGPYNYNTNRDAIYDYWEQRAIESSDYENVYTIGMRGIHDSHMEGFSSMEEQINALGSIITDQRNILREHVNTDVTSVPQAFIPYKEVLALYDAGLELPEDVTIVWPDDNYGYIRRLNAPSEMNRPGGSGVYYHISYWGRPHDYLWLSTTHPGLIREEMTKAYQYDVRNMWVLNVGDIKPAEMNIQFFMDMAWDIDSFQNSDYSKTYIQNWCAATFNPELAESIASLMWDYYQLAFERRPEFMGFNQVEPTRLTNPVEYNHYFYNDQAAGRLQEYQDLRQRAEQLQKEIPHTQYDAYFQLVYYPVVCAASMNEYKIMLDKAYDYATRQKRASANDYASEAKEAYQRIVRETDYYNTALSSGKWNHMMDHAPRDLPVFTEPLYPNWEIPQEDRWGIAMEGSGIQRHNPDMVGLRYYLPEIYTWGYSKRFVDIYLKGTASVDWQISKTDDWIQVSQSSGTLSNQDGQKEERIWISVDRKKLTDPKSNGFITVKGPDRSFRIRVNTQDIPDMDTDRPIGIEQNGLVTIYAENYADKHEQEGAGWKTLHDLGHTGKSMMSWVDKSHSDIDSNNIMSQTGWVEYEFYTYEEGDAELILSALPTHPVHTDAGVTVAVSIDGQSAQIVDFVTHGRSEKWKRNVLSNTAEAHVPVTLTGPGKHTIRIYALDPHVILDYISIETGNTNDRYGRVKETVVQP